MALAMAAVAAHLMEMPGKMGGDAGLYAMLHRTLYPTFGQTAGTAGYLWVGRTVLAFLGRANRPR